MTALAPAALSAAAVVVPVSGPHNILSPVRRRSSIAPEQIASLARHLAMRVQVLRSAAFTASRATQEESGHKKVMHKTCTVLMVAGFVAAVAPLIRLIMKLASHTPPPSVETGSLSITSEMLSEGESVSGSDRAFQVMEMIGDIGLLFACLRAGSHGIEKLSAKGLKFFMALCKTISSASGILGSLAGTASVIAEMKMGEKGESISTPLGQAGNGLVLASTAFMVIVMLSLFAEGIRSRVFYTGALGSRTEEDLMRDLATEGVDKALHELPVSPEIVLRELGAPLEFDPESPAGVSSPTTSETERAHALCKTINTAVLMRICKPIVLVILLGVILGGVSEEIKSKDSESISIFFLYILKGCAELIHGHTHGAESAIKHILQHLGCLLACCSRAPDDLALDSSSQAPSLRASVIEDVRIATPVVRRRATIVQVEAAPSMLGLWPAAALPVIGLV